MGAKQKKQDGEGDGSICGCGRSPGGEPGNPFQYSCLENPMDRGACWATGLRVTNSRTQLKRLNIQAHQPLDINSNLQEIKRVEEPDKRQHKETEAQNQKVGNFP